MDLSSCMFFFVLTLLWTILVNGRVEDMWDGLTLKYGVHKGLPRRREDAERQHYTRQNDICKTDNYHGFLYRLGDDTKLLPIYDLNGWLAGIQAVIPGEMKGFNSKNQSINVPPNEIMPPILIGRSDAHPYTITAYFKHPQLLCSPIPHHGAHPGKGLYIQTGYDPIRHHDRIPMEARHLTPMWKKAKCLPFMGTHYFYNISREMECERIYPVFLMYDSEGKLAAFGWTFQGEPLEANSKISWYKLSPETFFFVFDPKQLPPCMNIPQFRVFGIRIWLQDHKKGTMQCASHINTTQNPPKTSSIITKYKNGLNTVTIQPPQQSKRSNSSTRNRIHYISFICIITVSWTFYKLLFYLPV